MVYQPGMAGGAMQLTWFDDHGREIGHLGEPDDYYQVELSPDGKKAAAAIGSFSYVIWVYDVKQNTRTRLTFGLTFISAQSGRTMGSKLHICAAESRRRSKPF